MNKKINDGIIALQYDPNTVLAFKGNPIESFTPTKAMFDNGQYIVTTHNKRSVNQKNFDIAVVSGIADRTYPGALLTANSSLVNNMPTLLAAKRGAVKLSANLPGIGDAGVVTIDNPSYSSVSTAIDKITSSWLANNESYNTPAMCTYNVTQVYSRDHLKVTLGVDLAEQVKLDFEAVYKNEKQIFVLTFKQIFYKVSIDTPECPAMFFADDEEWQNLLNSGVSDSTPPVYVANVSYGRTIFVTMETSDMSAKLDAKLKTYIQGGNIDVGALAERESKDCKYSAVMIGGNPEDINLISSQKIENIVDVINNGRIYSAKNPGAPISYTTAFMKGNEIAKINSSTEYVETASTIYTSGALTLSHKGGYIAKFYVTWREFNYDSNGNRTYQDRSWAQNDHSLTAPFSTTIPLPANAVDIHVKAIEKTGLLWEPWRTVIDSDVNLTPNAKVSIWGTTLNPKQSIEY